MLATEFDQLLPAAQREAHQPGGGPDPVGLHAEIDAFNAWTYDRISNGVYKAGFATTQSAYEANSYPLFEALDRVEAHLADPSHQPYLFGEHITEADCHLKMIRHDYPRIDRWYRRLYYDESELTHGAFRKTTFFDIYKSGYLKARHKSSNANLIVPAGPSPDILPL
ncbi:hypothetical protein BDV30DRAFT_241495 [Aspergillus minisclerotigenes]|uniref:GST C-terminal domain-containing protein n=1 Tax=Aspergillus minisclerotigenes TaxID=656917 RepID=A0A5N6IYI8_9EURO|nr:hypothetical protein BDV30DRAFT_241495 [Aspergillus minisclerotigenes]